MFDLLDDPYLVKPTSGYRWFVVTAAFQKVKVFFFLGKNSLLIKVESTSLCKRMQHPLYREKTFQFDSKCLKSFSVCLFWNVDVQPPIFNIQNVTDQGKQYLFLSYVHIIYVVHYLFVVTTTTSVKKKKKDPHEWTSQQEF